MRRPAGRALGKVLIALLVACYDGGGRLALLFEFSRWFLFCELGLGDTTLKLASFSIALSGGQPR